MRLSWDDGLRGPLGKMDQEEAKFIHDIGYRVAGVGGPLDATDADADHARRVLEDAGLMPGPFWMGEAAMRPDPSEEREHQDRLRKALHISGRLGCPHLGYSVGSMHPQSTYMHHPENHTQKALDLLVEATKRLVPEAEKAGVVLCPETTQWTIVGSVDRMIEFVDRVNSPFLRICFDATNHMNAERVYDSGRFITCAVAALGDRIGSLHVKDVQVRDQALVMHLDEAPMGTGILDHEALIRASTRLEPWKTFSLEHIDDKKMWKPAYDHIQKIADRMGHRWSDPRCTRAQWQKG